MPEQITIIFNTICTVCGARDILITAKPWYLLSLDGEQKSREQVTLPESERVQDHSYRHDVFHERHRCPSSVLIKILSAGSKKNGSGFPPLDDHLAEQIPPAPGPRYGNRKSGVQSLNCMLDVCLTDTVYPPGRDPMSTLIPEHGAFGQPDDGFFGKSLDIPRFKLRPE
jgi:hypothetical protein